MLVILSGLPGSGKTAVADALGRHLGAPVLSVDPIEAAIRRCGIAPSKATGVAAYEVAAIVAEHHLRLGLSAIVDAVNALEVARDMFRQAAQRVGAAVRVIEVECSDRELHRTRLEGRARNIDGFPEPLVGRGRGSAQRVGALDRRASRARQRCASRRER